MFNDQGFKINLLQAKLNEYFMESNLSQIKLKWVKS